MKTSIGLALTAVASVAYTADCCLAACCGNFRSAKATRKRTTPRPRGALSFLAL